MPFLHDQPPGTLLSIYNKVDINLILSTQEYAFHAMYYSFYSFMNETFMIAIYGNNWSCEVIEV